MTIWFATGNAHKKRELAAILAPHTVRVPGDAGLEFDPEETGTTFLDNALIKARALFDLVREPWSRLFGSAGSLGVARGAVGAHGSENGENWRRGKNALLWQWEKRRTEGRFRVAHGAPLSTTGVVVVQETLEGRQATANGPAPVSPLHPILFRPEGPYGTDTHDAEKNTGEPRGNGERGSRVLASL
jgi:XTP/dITP diphosphohydrolase